jgi:Rab family protein
MGDNNGRGLSLKLTILGDPAVGKTSLTNKYVTNSFKESFTPILGVNNLSKCIRIEEINSKIRLLLCDIVGQEKYELKRQKLFQGCDWAFLVYDIIRYLTLEQIKMKWLEDFKKFSRSFGVYILIGNNSDLKDTYQVSYEEGKLLSLKINTDDFIETSGKYRDNAEDASKKLVLNILNKIWINFERN